MKLLLRRIARKSMYTIGKLYIDGTYVCDTLEDADRDLNRNGVFDNGEKKIYGQTAIPNGVYEITMKVKSPKFSKKASYAWCGGYLPRLLNVPHFEGILIHALNTADESEGCIGVGENKVVGKIINSMATLRHKVYPLLKKASDRGEKITIEIK